MAFLGVRYMGSLLEYYLICRTKTEKVTERERQTDREGENCEERASVCIVHISESVPVPTLLSLSGPQWTCPQLHYFLGSCSPHPTLADTMAFGYPGISECLLCHELLACVMSPNKIFTKTFWGGHHYIRSPMRGAQGQASSSGRPDI